MREASIGRRVLRAGTIHQGLRVRGMRFGALGRWLGLDIPEIEVLEESLKPIRDGKDSQGSTRDRLGARCCWNGYARGQGISGG